MNKKMLTGILCVLYFAIPALSQNENDGQIDSVSLRIFWSFQDNHPENLDIYLVKHEDLTHLISLFKEKMSDEELDKAFNEIDSVPEKESIKWYKKFHNSREKMEEYSIDWKSANYLSSEIEFKIEEMVKLTTAKVKARFESDDKMYVIEYDVVKMPRGWVFGNRLNFRAEDEN